MPAVTAAETTRAKRLVQAEGQIACRTYPHEAASAAGDARRAAETVHYDADASPGTDRPATGLEQSRTQDGSRTSHVHHGDRRPPGWQASHTTFGGVQPQGRKRREEKNGGAFDPAARAR